MPSTWTRQGDDSLTTTARAVVFLLLLWLATQVGELATTGGASLFWPPAAVTVLYALRERTSLVVSVVLFGRLGLWALSGPDLERLPQALLSSLIVAGVYGGVGAVLRAWPVRPGSASLAATLRLLVVAVVAGPALAGFGSRVALAVLQSSGLGDALAAGWDFALGDALAVVTIVPVVLVARLPSEPSALHRRVEVALTGACVLGVVVAIIVAGSPDALAVAAVSPMLVAGSLLGRRSTALVVLVAGSAAAARIVVDAASVPRSLQAVMIIGAGVALLASTGLTNSALRELTAPPRVALTVEITRAMRRARLVIIVVITSYALIAAGNWTAPDLPPLWLAALLPSSLLVATNALSTRWDHTRPHSTWRAPVEVGFDLVAMLLLYAVMAPLPPFQSLPLGLIAVTLEAALRLRIRTAVAIGIGCSGALALARITELVPWAQVPEGYAPWSVWPGVLGLALMSGVIAWARGRGDRLQAATDELRLRAEMGAAVAVADRATIAAQKAQLEAEHQKLVAQSRALRAAVDELRDSRRALESFSGMVAHDLVSPLSTGMLLLDVAENESYPAAVREEMLGRVRSTLERGVTLVDRLHAHARSATVELQIERTDLAGLVRDVLDDLSGTITAAGAEVRVSTLLPEADVDTVLFGQLVANLVANAVRHGCTPGGTPEVRISGGVHDDGLRMTVSDHGPGLPEDTTDLFRAGRMLGGSVGIGLGLATCRSVVERHGGRIWAHADDETGGAAFTFVIPQAWDEPSDGIRGHRRGQLRGRTISVAPADVPQPARD